MSDSSNIDSFTLDDVLPNENVESSKDDADRLNIEENDDIVELTEDEFSEHSQDEPDENSNDQPELFGLDDEKDKEPVQEKPSPKRRKNKRPTLEERRALAILEQEQARTQQLEAQYAQLLEENQHLKKYSKAQEEHVNLTNRQALEVYENTLLEDLEQAELDGDVREKIRLQNQLAELKARKVYAETMSSSREDEEDESLPTYFGPDYYNSIFNEPRDEVFEAWAEKNRWINNPTLAAEAERVHDELQGRLSLEGRDDEIGTTQFYNEVGRLVRERFNAGNRPRARSSLAPRNVVSAPTSSFNYNSQNGLSDSRRPWATIPLDKEQAEFALKAMGQREAMAGKPLSKAQKLDRMRKHIWEDQRGASADNFEL